MDASAQITQSTRFLSLVIPAFNEAEGIVDVLGEAVTKLAKVCRQFEILVVDDGSLDSTAAEVAKVQEADSRVRLIRHPKNRGYGAALRTGFEAARGDRVAFTDADGQLDIADLPGLLGLAESHDVAVGYRADRKDPCLRRFYSWGYNALIRGLLGTGVRDCDCALKVFQKAALRRILPGSQHFFVNTEMIVLARQQEFSIAELPVSHRPRRKGLSKVHIGDIPKTLGVLIPFWWSRVAFPKLGRELIPEGAGFAWGGLSLLLMSLLLFFTQLGAPLLEPEEARYAEIARQMLEGESWLVPSLHGEPYLDKPPLLYWLTMWSYQIFGVSEWSARLPVALSCVLTTMFLYGWARKLLGPMTGFAAGAILMLSARYLFLGRLLTMNGLLCCWVTATLACAHLAVASGNLSRRWWLLSSCCCALAVFTKGPVGLALTLPAIWLLTRLDARLARPSWIDFAWHAFTSSFLLAAWCGYVACIEDGFISYFLGRHHLDRYIRPFDHEKPVWFFAMELLPGMLPWSLLWIPFGYNWLRRKPMPGPVGAAIVFGLWIALFFSLSGSKRPGYILPAMPPLAIALGWSLAQLWARVGSLPLGNWQGKLARCAVPAGFVFALIWQTVYLPIHAAKFTLKERLSPFIQLAQNQETQIVSFPRRWDSVSFYLKRSDVRLYSRPFRDELRKAVASGERLLVVLKGDPLLEQELRRLPGGVDVIVTGPPGSIQIAWLSPRLQIPDTLLAQGSTEPSGSD